MENEIREIQMEIEKLAGNLYEAIKEGRTGVRFHVKDAVAVVMMLNELKEIYKQKTRGA